MLLDGLLLFDTAGALTTTAASTNVIDLAHARDIGRHKPMKGFVIVTTTFQSTAASTLGIAFQGSTDNTTYTVMMSSPSIAKASMVAGAKLWDFEVPPLQLGQALPRYLRLYYTVGTADFTAGALTAALILDASRPYSYPAGLNVAN